MKIIDTLWFTGTTGVVGIVVGDDETTGKRKGFIGLASGIDEKADTDHIVSWGNPFTLDAAKQLVGLLEKK